MQLLVGTNLVGGCMHEMWNLDEADPVASLAVVCPVPGAISQSDVSRSLGLTPRHSSHYT